jgi:hypothetical protein
MRLPYLEQDLGANAEEMERECHWRAVDKAWDGKSKQTTKNGEKPRNITVHPTISHWQTMCNKCFKNALIKGMDGLPCVYLLASTLI